MDTDPVIQQAITAAKGPRPKKKVKVHKGPIHSSVAGRTDHLPMHVASGSYVIPADIISALGEGNSMAGFKVAQSIFSVRGPYDQPTGAMPYGGGDMPYGQPAPRKRAAGGYTSATGNPTANARAAAGDQRVIANRQGAAQHGGADTAGRGYLQGYQQQAAPRTGGTGSFGLPDPSRGGISSVFGVRGMTDLIDGGGIGASGDRFVGGPISMAANVLGINPYGSDGGNTGGQMAASGATPYTARATGGPVEDRDAVPIVAAGGEYVISPEEVTHIGGGSMEDGHKILDAFVKKMRKKTIRTLQSLPGPRKD